MACPRKWRSDDLRRTGTSAESCCLPALTRFTGSDRTGSDHHLPRQAISLIYRFAMPLTHANLGNSNGGVRERPNRHAWKACEGKPSVGSNPTSSALVSVLLKRGPNRVLVLAGQNPRVREKAHGPVGPDAFPDGWPFLRLDRRSDRVLETGMVSSNAETVEDYLEELAEDRRAAISVVRDTIVDSLPDGFVESMNHGMITYEVPLETYSETYNGQPLMMAALASQKNSMSVYLTSVYGNPDIREWFVTEYQATGMRMDMGKSCVRFRTLDSLPVALIGEVIARVSLDDFLDIYRASRP